MAIQSSPGQRAVRQDKGWETADGENLIVFVSFVWSLRFAAQLHKARSAALLIRLQVFF